MLLRVFVFCLFPLALGLSAPAHFKTNHEVWVGRWLSRPLEGGGRDCEVLEIGKGSNRLTHLRQEPVVVERESMHEIEGEHHHHQDHHDDEEAELIVTVYALQLDQVKAEMSARCVRLNETAPAEQPLTADVVKEIKKTGDPANRIDVVFMGDGYTANQQTQMDKDNQRLVDDMFADVTFSQYLPVFNIWSVYRPSTETGIGVGGKPKNTAFGLYRDGTELRGVYCSKTSAARDACKATGPNACDFPSLIGNDPYYGGLGGEFTISTQSPTSGTIVLRHEMGHNFVRVGEEYDGGQVYSGVNHSPLSQGTNVPWKSWLQAPLQAVEQAEIRVQSYAWYDLAKGAYTINFQSDGKYARWLMRYSVSGCDTQDSLSITLDGAEIPWKTRSTLDRCLEEVYSDIPLAAGAHTLIFRQLTSPQPGRPIRQLCSVTLHEYKAEPEFHWDDLNYVGAFPTWRQGMSKVGYRPTNEKCLMRNMTSNVFCPICYEGMWMQFFAVISAIDQVVVQCGEVGQANIRLFTVQLGQLRPGGPEPGEFLQVRWFWQSQAMPEYNDKFEIQAPALNSGEWRVDVQYITRAVRYDPQKLLHFSQKFQVSCK